MPSSTIEPRTLTVDEQPLGSWLQAPPLAPSTAPQRKRSWFPLSFLVPNDHVEHDLETTLALFPTLNAIADHVEALSHELQIPVSIWGGLLQPERRTLILLVHCNPAIRDDITAHREFSRRLRQTFRCELAGLDVDNDGIWLYAMSSQTEEAA